VKKTTIVEIIASLLVFLFIYAALSKLLDFNKFKYQLGQSPFITNISRIVVWVIPLSEILVSVALMIKRTRVAGLYLSFFLMLLFTGYIFIMLHYSPYLPCSCGGILSSMSWKQHFIFNLLFTCLSLLGFKFKKIRTDYKLNRNEAEHLNKKVSKSPHVSFPAF
jgi:hypothetical protein